MRNRSVSRTSLTALPGLAIALAACAVAGAATDPPPVLETAFRKQAILTAAEAVADWQLAHLPERAARPGGRSQKVTSRSWIRAVFFTGVVAAHRATGQERYLEAALELGEMNRWRPGRRTHHADDHCISQVYAELFLLRRDERMLAGTRERFDGLLSERRSKPLWSWADALFMSAPVAALLSAATGEDKYLDWLTSSWRQAEMALYDREHHLWYRDSGYVIGQDGSGPRAANGARVFWGRGNGWVMAATARVLAHMPARYPERSRFEQLLQEMAQRLVELQGADGLWRSSLLDPDSHPEPEASGSALIAFALAAGVNQGVLGDEYLEPVRQAWQGLAGLVDADGRLGWVQPVGRAPAAASADDTTEYGAGAFLLAAEQMAALAPE